MSLKFITFSQSFYDKTNKPVKYKKWVRSYSSMEKAQPQSHSKYNLYMFNDDLALIQHTMDQYICNRCFSRNCKRLKPVALERQ